MAAGSLVDIAALDRAAGEFLGVFDDVTKGVTVVWVAMQRPGVQHELAARGAGVGGDDRDLDAELVGRAGLALADAFGLRGMEGIQLPTTLALLLGPDLTGARQRESNRCLEILMAFDLPADVTDQPAEPGAQDAQFPAVAVELFGMGVAPRHQRPCLNAFRLPFGAPAFGTYHSPSLATCTATRSRFVLRISWPGAYPR